MREVRAEHGCKLWLHIPLSYSQVSHLGGDFQQLFTSSSSKNKWKEGFHGPVHTACRGLRLKSGEETPEHKGDNAREQDGVRH